MTASLRRMSGSPARSSLPDSKAHLRLHLQVRAP
jgi:hypothetical protein